MHRLVQRLIRDRLTASDRSTRAARINSHADHRGDMVERESGPPVQDWELSCLRDIALCRIEQGDRGGLLLADRITPPLVRSNRALHIRDSGALSAGWFRQRFQAAPEMPSTHFFLHRA